jgi:hypothetical protein
MSIMITPTTPRITVANALTLETAVMVFATLRNSLWTPLAKTMSSRFSVV